MCVIPHFSDNIPLGDDVHKVMGFRLTTHHHDEKALRNGPSSQTRDTTNDLIPYGEFISVQFDAFDQHFDWNLNMHKTMLAENAILRAVLANGTVYERPARVLSYTGWNGLDGGWVRLTVTKDKTIRGKKEPVVHSSEPILTRRVLIACSVVHVSR